MMNKVYLHGLKCEALIGVWPWERHIRQTLTLDLEMQTDIRHAASRDRLEDALNYQQVSERVTEFVGASQYRLLETLADKLADLILQEFAVSAVLIKLDKGSAVSNVKHVGVMVERRRDDDAS
jgi:dihydroneopterin aldolase